MKSGNRYFHPDCLKKRDDMETVKKLYFENISDTVVPAQLVKTSQNIVIGKNVDSEYLVFAMRYVIANKIQLNSPYGLHYIIDNYKIKQAWKDRKAKEEQKKVQEEIQKLDKKEEITFTFVNKKKEGFESIFGGR